MQYSMLFDFAAESLSCRVGLDLTLLETGQQRPASTFCDQRIPVNDLAPCSNA